MGREREAQSRPEVPLPSTPQTITSWKVPSSSKLCSYSCDVLQELDLWATNHLITGFGQHPFGADKISGGERPNIVPGLSRWEIGTRAVALCNQPHSSPSDPSLCGRPSDGH